MSIRKSLNIIYRFLIIIYKTNSKIVIGNLFLRFLLAILPIISLWIGKLIIDAITNQLSTSFVIELVAVEAFIGVLLMLANRSIRFFNDLVNQEFSISVSSQIIRHAHEFSAEELENAEFYNLMSRAIDETENASGMIEHILEDIEQLVSIVFYAITVIVYNGWIILLFILSLFPSIVGEFKFYTKFYLLRQSWTDNRREIDYLTWLSTTENNLKEIKIYQLCDYLVNKLTTKKTNYFKLEKNLRKRQVLICSSLSVLSLLCYYLAYVYVAYDALIGVITIGTMVYLTAALRNINTQVSQVFSSFTWLSYKSMYINDFFLFMDKKPKNKHIGKDEKNIKEIVSCIELKDVGFKYPNATKWAIRHVDLKINVGQKIAILGTNGSGKTTLLKILTGLYQPTEGKILIDGIDMKDIENCNKLFGIIFQDYIKYEFEARENIGISDLDEINDNTRIEKYAERSGAAEIIERLPLKYKQVLSNRFKNGMQLSGGEWQKIAVARAMFSDRPVLILDEPSASMDILSEKRLFENLLANYSNEKNRTIILVSHRMSQLKDIERIIVMENGQIIEEGTHQELIHNKNTYSRMYEAYVNR